MATLLSCATGNWLTAATWALVDSTSFLNSETANSTLTTTPANNRSAAFTPGAITVDGIAVKLSNRTGTTGTITVRLWNDTDGTNDAGETCTIDVADLPPASSTVADGGWIFFKWAAPVTLIAGKSYRVEAFTSNGTQVALYRDATAVNWSRALRTTTTQAPVAGDDVIVAGEHTGQGTGNDITVTMNETASTDYGANTTSAVTPAIAIGARGTLTFNSASAGNPYLRLSGWMVGYNGGTLNIGTTGTPIPRDSVAVLEFDPAADGDRGFQGRNGFTVNIQGLSRTSGKNVDRCLLTVDAPSVANLIETQTIGQTNVTAAVSGINSNLDPSLTSLVQFFNSATRAAGVSDTAVNATHALTKTPSSSVPGNTTQTFGVWLRRGTGTNNRHVRLVVGSSAVVAPTNGFFADFDLQAVTAGTCTAIGNGTATSASITAVGDGFYLTITGAVSSGTATPSCIIAGCSAAGTTTFTGDATQMWQYYGMGLFTASSVPRTLTVSADTGWLDGDVVAVASTTRTAAECEPMQLSANAGASSFDTEIPLVVSHSGTSPTQAEIILLTRNVKIRSVSNTLMSFFNVKAGCIADIDWAEFYNLGDNTTDKRGVDFEMSSTTNGANFNIQNCSLHDFEDLGLYFNTGASGLITSAVASNNVLWNCATLAGPAIQVVSAIDVTNWEMDNNILIRNQTGNGFTVADVGGKFTNNTVVGSASIGMSFAEGSGVFGNFADNTAHSNVSSGFGLAGVGQGGLLDGIMSWRNNGNGLAITSPPTDLVVKDLVAFGNVTHNVALSSLGGSATLKSPVLNGDTTFSTTNGITFSASAMNFDLRVEDGDLSTVSGIKTAHSSDITINSVSIYSRTNLYNTKLGASVEVSSQTEMSALSFVSAQKLDQTAGNHKTWLRGGTLSVDTTIFNTASPSLRMTTAGSLSGGMNITCTSGSDQFTMPQRGVVGQWIHHSSAFPNCARITAFDPLTGIYTASVNASASVTNGGGSYGWPTESSKPRDGIKVPVASGQTVSISVYTRRSAVGDGTAYNGLQPRLILKANPALGVTDDTVLDTHSAADGTWEQLSGTTPSATDDGAFEFVVDCASQTGWINVDDWAVT